MDTRRPRVRVLRALQRHGRDPRSLARDASGTLLRSDYRSPPLPRRAYAYILEPTWSPDATRIAVSDSWNGYSATIRIVSVTTKKWTSVTKPRGQVEDVDPAWSPHGRTIAFARRLNGGTPMLYLVHPDGSALRRLTNGRSPSLSPDGKYLAFALGGSVYEIGADGRGRKRILRGLRNPLVRWSPDGRKLLYTSGSTFRGDVWTAGVDGTHRRRILHRVAIDGIAPRFVTRVLPPAYQKTRRRRSPGRAAASNIGTRGSSGCGRINPSSKARMLAPTKLASEGNSGLAGSGRCSST